VWKISPPPVFDPWTVQPIGSRYTDYATLANRYGDICLPLLCKVQTVLFLQYSVFIVYVALILRFFIATLEIWFVVRSLWL
jgi:hypothetical protein